MVGVKMSIYEASITNPKKQLEFYKQLSEQLQQENKLLKEKYLNAVADYETTMSELQELRKQLEEKENIACNWKDSCLENAGKIEELENQQKEFIKYLEKRYKDITSVIGSYGSNTDMLYGKKDILEEIFQEFKSIIGDDK